jgi:arylsulfatase A
VTSNSYFRFYADKKIGLIINKLKKPGLDNNTIVVYAGDNGTQREISSLFRRTSSTGAKGKTIEYGIHVPLICRWPAKITPGSLNNDLIDFTDILPTFADIAGIPTLNREQKQIKQNLQVVIAGMHS